MPGVATTPELSSFQGALNDFVGNVAMGQAGFLPGEGINPVVDGVEWRGQWLLAEPDGIRDKQFYFLEGDPDSPVAYAAFDDGSERLWVNRDVGITEGGIEVSRDGWQESSDEADKLTIIRVIHEGIAQRRARQG